MSGVAQPPVLRSFHCWVGEDEDTATTVDAFTRAKARYRYYLDIKCCFNDLKIHDINVRSFRLRGPASPVLLTGEKGWILKRPSGNGNIEIMLENGRVGYYHPLEVF